ncbi:glycosyltransferase [Patescibacteria group bacterium]|nr:glycosyltransferase [Patescibacteria group bacterium]
MKKLKMENKKKILIFSTTYHPFVGGAEVAVKEITDRLGEDFEFDMITLRFDKNLPSYEKIGNVGVYRVGFVSNSPNMSDLVKFPLKLNKFLYPFLSWWKAGDLYAEKKYDAVWAMMASFSGFGAVFFKLGHLEVPYLLTLQEGDPIPEIKKKVKLVYPLFKKIFTKADRIQVISNYLGRWAKDMGGKNIEVIPNAVSVEQFSQLYPAEDLNELKKIWGSEGDEFIITTSRLVKKNAIDDIIKALKYLPENIKFIVLGDGPDWEDLEKLSEEMELRKRVKFLGSIEQKEIPKYLKASDIFIRPSLSEGFGNSFIEAMASEIPVIATQEGGIADFIFDEKRNLDKETTGWAIDVRNPEQIAEAVKDILANPEKTAKVVARAKKMVTEKYDWEIIAKDMKEKVFNNLLEI